MREAWNKTIYIATKSHSLNKYGRQTYNEPQKYRFNVQPSSSKLDIEMFGERAREMQKTLIERNLYEGKFNEGDLVYLDGATPEGEAYNGANANYKMLPPRNQNFCITIYMEKIVKQGEL